MLEYLIDSFFVEFDGRVYQQTIGIPMGTNCALLLADLFLYSYEAEFVQSLLQAGKKYSQTCLKQPPMGSLKCGCWRQVAA